MRIIKVQIQKPSGKSLQIIKQAISLNYKRHTRIKDFIRYVKKICLLDDLDYDMELDGFVLAHYDQAKALQEKHVYRVVEKRSVWQDDQDQQQEDLEEERQKQKMRMKKKQVNKYEKKRQVKHSKIAKKKLKIEKKRQKSSDSQSQESLSQEDSLSQQSQKIIPTKPIIKKPQKINQQLKKNDKVPKPRIIRHSSSSSSSQKLPTLAVNQFPKEIEVILPPKQKISQIKDKNEQIVNQNEKNIKNIQKDERNGSFNNEKVPQKNQLNKKDQSAPHPPQKKNNIVVVNKIKNKPTLNVLKKKIVEASSSQSQSDPTPPQKPREKASNILPQPKENPIFKPSAQSSTTQVKLLPAALRNKLYQKKFQDHKQNQWLVVNKQKLKSWNEKGNKQFCKPNNKIRYKIIQFDQQKFIPIKSDWIYAQVKQISKQGKIILQKVQENGRFRSSAQIFQFNMDQLQIFKPLATEQQLSCLNPGSNNQTQQQQKEKVEVNQNIEEKNEVMVNNSNQSIEKFICGQANYYFSDKNYNFDLFMQMHANRDPQKYLNLRILLNFPKIKKFIRDEDKLIQYLKQDDRYDTRNYEIDYQRRLIRKKGAYKAPQVQNNQKQEGEQHDEIVIAVEMKQNKQAINESEMIVEQKVPIQ